MGADLSGLIAEASAELGVEWCLGRSVAAVDAEGVTLDDGQRIEAKTVVWTVGVRASTLTGQIPGERDARVACMSTATSRCSVSTMSTPPATWPARLPTTSATMP